MLFQKFINNPKNFSNGKFTDKGTNKFISYGVGLGVVFGAAVQKVTGILETSIPAINDWNGLGDATEHCTATETGRSLLQKVQDFSLADIDPSVVANCINDAYMSRVASVGLAHDIIAPMLTGTIGALVGMIAAYQIGCRIERNPQPFTPKI